jgi:hypothetical protein
MAINFGDILGGLGAAYGGRAQEYAQGIQQREQGLTERKRAELEARQRAMYEDANTAFGFLSNPELTYEQRAENIIRLSEDRLDALSNYPDADPSDTMQVLDLATQMRDGTDPTAVNRLSQILLPAYSIYKQRYAPQQAAPEEYTLSQGEARFRGGQQIAGVAEAVEPGFEIMTPEQVAAIPTLDATKTYKRNMSNNDIVQIGGGGTTVNVGNATEGERKAGTLANRLDYAMAQINDVIALNPAAQMPGKVATVFDAMGMDYLATLSNDADRQIVDAAQLDMLDAALTLATGAAYTKEQLEGYKKSYFPQLGNDPEVIAAKKQRLQNTIEAAYAAAGRAAPENMFSSEIGANEPAIPAGVPAGSVFIGNAREDGKRVFRAPDGTNYKED